MNPLESWIVWANAVWDRITSPWSVYQILIVVTAYFIARLLAKQAEPWCDSKLRLIKGKPGLLRLLVAIKRNLHWLTNIRGKVLLALWDAFDENDINIPFPHREIIIKNAARSGHNSEQFENVVAQQIHD